MSPLADTVATELFEESSRRRATHETSRRLKYRKANARSSSDIYALGGTSPRFVATPRTPQGAECTASIYGQMRVLADTTADTKIRDRLVAMQPAQAVDWRPRERSSWRAVPPLARPTRPQGVVARVDRHDRQNLCNSTAHDLAVHAMIGTLFPVRSRRLSFDWVRTRLSLSAR
jgi:hypothetical protein